jgi:predicted acylesterase/phospholipase RssA
MYNKLVLSGGSKRGVITLGSLEYLYEKETYMKDIQTFIGTSVGAIFCYFLIIGYKPMKLITYLITNDFFSKLKTIDIVKLSNCDGSYNWNIVGKYIKDMTLNVSNKLYTLKELYDTYNKELICITYNYTKQTEEVLSYKTHPDLPCIDALQMSSSIPLYFPRYKYNDDYYIDGGFVNNFPINLLDEDDNAIAINCTKMHINEKENMMITNYIFNLTSLVVINNVNNNIKNNKCKNLLLLDFNSKDISTHDMYLSNIQIFEKFSLGYKNTKDFFTENKLKDL